MAKNIVTENVNQLGRLFRFPELERKNERASRLCLQTPKDILETIAEPVVWSSWRLDSRRTEEIFLTEGRDIWEKAYPAVRTFDRLSQMECTSRCGFRKELFLWSCAEALKSNYAFFVDRLADVFLSAGGQSFIRAFPTEPDEMAKMCYRESSATHYAHYGLSLLAAYESTLKNQQMTDVADMFACTIARAGMTMRVDIKDTQRQAINFKTNASILMDVVEPISKEILQQLEIKRNGWSVIDRVASYFMSLITNSTINKSDLKSYEENIIMMGCSSVLNAAKMAGIDISKAADECGIYRDDTLRHIYVSAVLMYLSACVSRIDAAAIRNCAGSYPIVSLVSALTRVEDMMEQILKYCKVSPGMIADVMSAFIMTLWVHICKASMTPETPERFLAEWTAESGYKAPEKIYIAVTNNDAAPEKPQMQESDSAAIEEAKKAAKKEKDARKAAERTLAEEKQRAKKVEDELSRRLKETERKLQEAEESLEGIMSASDMDEPDTEPITEEELEAAKYKRILFVGGFEGNINAMQREFPNAKFFNEGLSFPAPELLDFGVYFTNNTSHSAYKVAKRFLATNGVRGYYSTATSIAGITKELAGFCRREAYENGKK